MAPSFANLRAHKREIGDLDLCFPVHALDECIPSWATALAEGVKSDWATQTQITEGWAHTNRVCSGLTTIFSEH